ncbi:MAG: glycoside hydrolase family 88 protein, partial [Clostridia bacterium]|nr:glycoside hydrolase family 88 protein [Clostridia bacterium]
MKAVMPEGWAEQMKVKLEKKMRFAVSKAQGLSYIPYTTQDGEWAPTDICWWTNGFWGAELWQMFLMTGDTRYRDSAVCAERMMDEALHNIRGFDHDAGFRWLIQSGVRHALEKNQESFDRTLLSANLLAARFNPNGFIRAWNGEGREGWAIIDCMMNLPLLCWASRQTGDPRFKLIAMRHADTAMKHFVRTDGSCNH